MTPVRFKFMTPEGEPLATTAFEIELPCSGYHTTPEGVVLPGLIEATTDADGEALVELWPLPNAYQVSAWDPVAKSELFYKFIVPELPEGETELRLQDIIVSGFLVSEDLNPTLLADMLAVRAQTLALRNATEVLRDQTEALRDQAEALLPYVGETPPVDPEEGWEWTDTTTGRTYVWWVDENSGQWVERSAVVYVNYIPLGVVAANVGADPVGDLIGVTVAAQLAELDANKAELAGDVAQDFSAKDIAAAGSVTVGTVLNEHMGADIASAATIDLDAATGNLVDVTGTTTITAITLSEGCERTVRFTGVLTLTHGASLVLPGAADITTEAGTYAIFRGYATGVVRCVFCSAYITAQIAAAITARAASDIAAGISELATAEEYATGTDSARVLTPAVARAQNLVLSAAQTATGATIDFNNIPSWVRRITIIYSGVSTTAGNMTYLQIGDSDGIETSGYECAVTSGTSVNYATGAFLLIANTTAGVTVSGHSFLTKIVGNEWVFSGISNGYAGVVGSIASGKKTLSGTLDRISLTNVSADTFDAGKFNIICE